jgi:ABC-type sugar transport system ATPase subunit
MKNEVLRMDSVCVSAGKEKIYNVNLNLFKGEILGLIGLNDSGKSTIIKVLAGIYSVDKGTIYLNGRETHLDCTNNSYKRGIFCIFQKPQLIPNLTIAENIFVVRNNTLRKIKINEQAINFQASELLKSIGCNFNPKISVGNLSKAEQHLILIAKALSFDASVIVIDDIVDSYTKQEIDIFKKVLLHLSKRGVSFIFANNQFVETMGICNRIMLVRAGTIVKTLYQGEYSKGKISTYLVGYAFSDSFEKSNVESHEEILKVKSLFTKGILNDINFCLNKGEVLGFLDLDGASIEELAQVLFNPKLKSFGSIKFKGKEIIFKNYRDALKHGIGLIPENGLINSAFYDMSIFENIIFMKLKKISRFFIINSKLVKFAVTEFADFLNIRDNLIKTKMKNLNKHDQQRVIMYRWLLMKPDILIMIKPSSGIDVVSKREIYSLIDNMRKSGVSVIILSTDASEVLSMSNRIIVMSNGRIKHEFVNGESAQEELRKLIE